MFSGIRRPLCVRGLLKKTQQRKSGKDMQCIASVFLPAR